MSKVKDYLWDLAEEFVSLEFQPFSQERHDRMVAIVKEVAGVESFGEMVEWAEGEYAIKVLSEQGML